MPSPKTRGRCVACDKELPNASCEAPCDCTDSFEDDSRAVVNSPRMGVCGYGG